MLAGCVAPKPTSETFVWKGKVSQDSWLRLRNSSGNFSVSEGTSDSAEIRLVIERKNSYSPTAIAKVVQTADGVVACVLYGDGGNCSSTGYRSGSAYRNDVLPFLRGRTSVTGTIVLPRGVKLDVESVNGDVDVASASRDLIVGTTNGDIAISGARGPVRVSSTNGDVEVGVDSVAGDISATTTNGDVTMFMPPTFNANLTMNTVNGELDLGFPANITAKSRKAITAVVGAGGIRFSVTTTNGDVSVRPRREGGA
jgi:hypothetical protein